MSGITKKEKRPVGRVTNMVVHCKHDHYDIYIGRGPCPRTGRYSKWSNPFRIGIDGTRDEVLEKYYHRIQTQPHLLAALSELQGKVLGCWCRPHGGFRGRLLCHGQILVSLCIGCKPEEVE